MKVQVHFFPSQIFDTEMAHQHHDRVQKLRKYSAIAACSIYEHVERRLLK